ncbi:MAG: DUF5329 domain-containing protein [Deltaproteobacteria bacterium]|jgi:hypothetical protein|nr:DUF5329 domain-containing protein [Deltaproteobacteria bacterium]
MSKYKVVAAALVLGLFLLCPARASALSEVEAGRVEGLLAALGEAGSLEFIRNGKAYSASRAVSHLRSKLNRVKDRLSTAEEFVDKVASGSSMSGDPYLVRFADGREITAGEYFHDLLKGGSPGGD